MDMLVDGRRVYSFWVHRDGSRAGGRIGSRWRVPWPRTLQEFLDGTARFTVVVHETGETGLRRGGDARLGLRPDRDPQPQRPAAQPRQVLAPGRHLRQPQRREQVEPLLDAIEVVLARAPQDAGIEAFLAYGTLLGAVREGKLLGHDGDADLGYVSHHTHPVDVIRESFRLQRDARRARLPDHPLLGARLQGRRRRGRRRGPRPRRLRRLPDGRPPLPDGGDPGARSRSRGSIPLGTTTLEGRTFPAPADPDKLLTAMYGPWRTPDPAFQFAPPDHDRAPAQRLVPRAARRPGQVGPDLLAQCRRPLAPSRRRSWHWARRARADAATYVDLGCGRGVRRAVDGRSRGAVGRAGLPGPRSYADGGSARPRRRRVTFWRCNLLELRDVLPAGAILARRPGRTAPHRTPPRGHAHAARAAAPVAAGPDGAGRRGRRPALPGVPGPLRRRRLRPGSCTSSGAAPRMLVAELERAGATIVHRETHRGCPTRRTPRRCAG